MALLFIDSFATYSVAGELTNKWTSVVATSGAVALGVGQFGAPCVSFAPVSAVTQYIYKQLPANSMKRIGFWYSFTGASNGGSLALRYTPASGVSTPVSTWLRFYPDGSIEFFNGASGVAVSVGTLPIGTLLNGSTYWIEFEIKSTGLKLYIDGILVFSYTGSITTSPNIVLLVYGLPAVTTHKVSHLVIWDDTGTTFSSFPIGPQRTQAIRPTAAGAVADWTPASGANWQAVDSAGWAGGVGVSTLVTAKDDKHNCADLAWNSYRINSVVLSLRAVDLNTGGSAVAPLLQDASGTAVGSYVSLPMTNPTILTQNFDKDSAGGDWTKVKIDAMQIGYRSQV